MKRTLLLGLTMLSLLFNACQQATSIDQEAIKKEIRSNWDGFIEAWEQEDATTCASYYKEDGLNIPPEFGMNEGRTAIDSFYTFLFSANLGSKYRHTIEDFVAFEGGAFEYGSFEVDWTRNDSTSWTFRGRSMTKWEQEADGTWKIDKFLFNTPPQ